MNPSEMLATQWRKSSRSGDTGGDCVEVALIDPMVAVRDSKDPSGPKFLIAPSGWRLLVWEIKRGEHDLA
jgi:hypothetical protein